MTLPDDFEYEEELVLDDDLPVGFQVYESAEDYAAEMQAQDDMFDDDDDIRELLEQAQSYNDDSGFYD